MAPTSPLQVRSPNPKANKRSMNWMKNQLRRFKGAGVKTQRVLKPSNNTSQTVLV